MKDASQCKGRILSQTVEYIQYVACAPAISSLTSLSYLQGQVMQLGSMAALRERLPQDGSDPLVSAEPFALSTGLEVLRPSPEPERSANDWHEHFSHDTLI